MDRGEVKVGRQMRDKKFVVVVGGGGGDYAGERAFALSTARREESGELFGCPSRGVDRVSILFN